MECFTESWVLCLFPQDLFCWPLSGSSFTHCDSSQLAKQILISPFHFCSSVCSPSLQITYHRQYFPKSPTTLPSQALLLPWPHLSGFQRRRRQIPCAQGHGRLCVCPLLNSWMGRAGNVHSENCQNYSQKSM